MPIIDFHTHYTHYKNFTPTLQALMDTVTPSREEQIRLSELYEDPTNFVALLKDAGVDYAVVLAEYTTMISGVVSNEFVAEYCKGHKELLPFCSVNPYLHSNPAKIIKNLLETGSYKGIKLYPVYNLYYPNDPKIYPIYDVAQEMRAPILFHTGTSVFKSSRVKYGNPISYDDVAVDFPDLRLILAHSGRGSWYEEAMTVTRLHENLYLEVSGLPVRKLLTFFPDMERFSHKFIWGSDWPQVEQKKILATFRQLGLSEQALNNILGGNAARILSIDS